MIQYFTRTLRKTTSKQMTLTYLWDNYWYIGGVWGTVCFASSMILRGMKGANGKETDSADVILDISGSVVNGIAWPVSIVGGVSYIIGATLQQIKNNRTVLRRLEATALRAERKPQDEMNKSKQTVQEEKTE